MFMTLIETQLINITKLSDMPFTKYIFECLLIFNYVMLISSWVRGYLIHEQPIQMAVRNTFALILPNDFELTWMYMVLFYEMIL